MILKKKQRNKLNKKRVPKSSKVNNKMNKEQRVQSTVN